LIVKKTSHKFSLTALQKRPIIYQKPIETYLIC